MKKTILLIFILLLCLFAFFKMYQGGDDRMESLLEERDFKVDDIDEVAKIVISPKGHETTTLVKEKENWLYGSKKKLVRKNVMDNLLQVIEGIRVQYIPKPAAIKNIMRDLDKSGVDVKVYNKRGKLLKGYQIGGVTPDERGTYMLLDGAKQPFVVELINFEGSVRNRYLNKEIDWLDRTVLREDVSKIKQIKVDYPKDLAHSFVLKNDNGLYMVKEYSENAAYTNVANQARTIAYVEGYEKVVSEYIENENEKRDSVSRLVPFAIINISYEDETEKWLRFFPIGDLLDSKRHTVELEQTKQITRYFLDTSWGDFYLVQQRLVGKLLRGHSFFTNE